MVIDIIILLLLVLAVFNGIRKGFVAQVVAIVALILGVWLSCRFGALVGGWTAEKFHSSVQLMNCIAFALIFFIVISLLTLLGRLIEKTFKLLLLGWLNRLLGIIFALCKFFIIIGLCVLLVNFLNNEFGFPSNETLAKSHLFGPLTNAVSSVFPYLKNMLLGA